MKIIFDIPDKYLDEITEALGHDPKQHLLDYIKECVRQYRARNIETRIEIEPDLIE